jgi:hypothetical protein
MTSWIRSKARSWNLVSSSVVLKISLLAFFHASSIASAISSCVLPA